MWAFPFAAAIVSAVFGGLIAQQWLARGRPYRLAWSIALFMFAIASFAAAIGMLGGWTPLWFRIYYLFGAIVNVPVLAAGTLYLLARRPIAHLFAALIVVGSIFATGAMFSVDLDETALREASASETAVEGGRAGIPAGGDVMGAEALPRVLSRYFSFTGFFIVVGGALWSAWRMARRKEAALQALAKGNILIAAGTFVVAVASGFARLGQGLFFAVGLLAGVSLMFVGFLATRGPREQKGAESL